MDKTAAKRTDKPAERSTHRAGCAGASSLSQALPPMGNQCMQRLLLGVPVQAQLHIGAPGDPLEREADAAAERVLGQQPAGVKPGGVSALHRRSVDAAPAGAAAGATAAVQQTLAQRGQTLGSSVRREMEGRFGHDFAQVQIHHDARAASSAGAIGARAYTAGGHIVFAAGRYAPQTLAGRRLLAHELAHVVQQAPAASARDAVATPALLQRELAIEPPHPEAEAGPLTPEQMRAAIAYNQIFFSRPAEIEMLRDVLGAAPLPAVIDEDFVNAVASWQAQQGSTVDGKLDPTTASQLSREYRAEARFLGRTEGRALRDASRHLDRRSFTITVTQRPLELTNTGSAEYAVRWGVPDAQASGWIIQHVTFAATKQDGSGNALAVNNGPLEYWEGWQVRRGRVFVGSSAAAHRADTFRTVDEGAGTRGRATITGRVTFMPDFDLREPPWGHTVPAALALPTLTVAPPGWSDGLARLHQLRVAWDDTVAPATHSATATP